MTQQSPRFTLVDVPSRRTYWIGGQRQSLIVGGDATAGRYTLSHVVIPPGGGAAEHEHGVEAEAFYILAGRLRFAWEGGTRELGRGAFLHLEPGLPYGFEAIGDEPAELLVIYAPAGLEDFIAAVGVADAPDEAASREAAERSMQDLAAMKERAGAFGLTYTGGAKA